MIIARLLLVGSITTAIACASTSSTPETNGDAARFVGSWTYAVQADDTFACPDAPTDIDAAATTTGTPPAGAPAGDGGAAPDLTVSTDDAGTARFVRKSTVATAHITLSGNGELDVTTDEPCTWHFTVQGTVATMKPNQTCDQFADPNQLGQTTIAANVSSNLRLSADGNALTEDLIGLLGGICTAERKGSLERGR